jgi:molybdopterin-guanine dinucleotide biosynthesis protein A
MRRYRVCVLAAGSGTRFGGNIPKQLYPIGNNGEILTYFNLANAYAAGFTEAVIITKKEFIDPLTTALQKSNVEISFALQGIPVGRTKPCGTVDAMLQATSQIAMSDQDRLLVINADDLYPQELFQKLKALADSEPVTELMASFPISNTMTVGSKNNRGVVHFNPETLEVTSIEETYGIEYRSPTELVATGKDGNGTTPIRLNAPVSMTTWMLTGKGMKDAKDFFEAWWNDPKTDKANDELPHPIWIDSLLKRGEKIKNVPLLGHVRGLTSQDDIEPLRDILHQQGY